MPTVLSLAARSLTRLPPAPAANAINKQAPAPSRSPTPATSPAAPSTARASPQPARNPVTAKSYSTNMSTETFKYRDPVVFNAREKHTGTVCCVHLAFITIFAMKLLLLHYLSYMYSYRTTCKQMQQEQQEQQLLMLELNL
jgi:hypothetical protein